MASWLRSLTCGTSIAGILACFLLLLALCSGEDFMLEWSPDGVREYNSSNPLAVELGDKIVFSCPAEGNFNYSNLWIQGYEEQIDRCDCTVVPTETCDPAVDKNGQCIAGVVGPILRIISNDADLGSVLNFQPGQWYYLASYAPINTLAGAFSELSSGGQCLQGLKMVIEVVAIPTEPATAMTTAANDTGAPSNEVTVTSPATSSTGDKATTLSGEATTSTAETVVEILLLPSQDLRDWHVVVIVVLGAVMLALVMLLVIGAIGYTLYRRRGHLVLDAQGSSISDECKQQEMVVVANPDESSYPDAIFKDPLN